MSLTVEAELADEMIDVCVLIGVGKLICVPVWDSREETLEELQDFW